MIETETTLLDIGNNLQIYVSDNHKFGTASVPNLWLSLTYRK